MLGEEPSVMTVSRSLKIKVTLSSLLGISVILKSQIIDGVTTFLLSFLERTIIRFYVPKNPKEDRVDYNFLFSFPKSRPC